MGADCFAADEQLLTAERGLKVRVEIGELAWAEQRESSRREGTVREDEGVVREIEILQGLEAVWMVGPRPQSREITKAELDEGICGVRTFLVVDGDQGGHACSVLRPGIRDDDCVGGIRTIVPGGVDDASNAQIRL